MTNDATDAELMPHLTAVLKLVIADAGAQAIDQVTQWPAPPELIDQLVVVLGSGVEPSTLAEQLGDVFRGYGRTYASLANECYRAAFWIGDDWESRITNPLFARFGAKKVGLPYDKWVHYFDIYDRTLRHLRGTPVRLLEIGVYHGGGLDQLRAYLGPDAVLVGVDIDQSAADACAGRYQVAVGTQTDPEFLTSVVAEYGPFDVIIDDGGHTMAQQLITIETLFPLLADGGVFMVEDTHTSYWPEYQDAEVTFMNWVKDRLDDINGYHHHTERELPVWTTMVTGVHVYDSIVVFDKGRHFPPFCEVVGTGSFIEHDRISESDLLALRNARKRNATLEPQVQQLQIQCQQLETQLHHLTEHSSAERALLVGEVERLHRLLDESMTSKVKRKVRDLRKGD